MRKKKQLILSEVTQTQKDRFMVRIHLDVDIHYWVNDKPAAVYITTQVK